MPLDLSSANDSLKEKTVDSEKISETVDATITENSGEFLLLFWSVIFYCSIKF